MLSEIEDLQNHHPLLEYTILAIHSKVAHKWLGLMLNFPVFKWLIISTIKQHSKDPYTWETRNSSHIANESAGQFKPSSDLTSISCSKVYKSRGQNTKVLQGQR